MGKIKIDNEYKEKVIDLPLFLNLSTEEQKFKIKQIITEMYEEKVEVDDSMVMKIIKLTLTTSDDYAYLPHNLTIEKNNRELIFKFQKRGNRTPLLIILLATLLVGLFAATYAGIHYMNIRDLNKDIDGDGIPDINLDIDGDNIADVNIDTNRDDIPDINIDYKGDREPEFNIDTDGDGEPDENIVNPAEGTCDPTCKVNCDSNGDGWPDYNYDVDGDGKPDLDVDTDGDCEVDADIDLDGDKVCDVRCDEDGDGVCDKYCQIEPEDCDPVGSGSSSVTGNQDSTLGSGSLNIEYYDEGELLVEGMLPDDHPEGQNYPVKTFTVTNLSDFDVEYMVTMVVDRNTYTSSNFMYKIEATNGGFSKDFVTAPTSDEILATSVIIKANETQEYEITFKLQGTGEPQNYDQGKVFEGYIKIGE